MTELNESGYRTIGAENDSLTEREYDVLGRIAKGSSDQDIARELVLSINTVKWHNRNIYAKLGVSNRTQALAAATAWGLFDNQLIKKSNPSSSCKNNLPSRVSSFIGRVTEIKKITRLLDTTRLLTLTGPGGVGKTRLGLQVAAGLVETNAFPDGIYLVDLAPLNQPERVATVIVKVLGLYSISDSSSEELLRTHLRDKSLLLLIDNFEHLLQAALLVSTLMTAAPGLYILSTSREALNISGEIIYQVPPMAVPDLSGFPNAETLAEYESMALFLERARAVKNDFCPDKEELFSLAEICSRLDGLPLALELAASQVVYFPPRILQQQLEDRFGLLTDAPSDVPDRHQSLAKAIDWSYQLLTEEEQILFDRISVFQGGRTIDAVDQICCFDLGLDILDGLRSLLDKNMLQQDDMPHGEPRFIMLETIKEFSRINLQDREEWDEIQRRHAVYFLAKAEEGDQLQGSSERKIFWLEQTDADHDNIRAAFFWAMAGGDIEIGLRLIGALHEFWFQQGHYQEGEEWVEMGLFHIDQVPQGIQADVYASAGWVYYFINQLDKSREHYHNALDLYQQLNEQKKAAYIHIGLIGNEIGKPERDSYVRDHIQKAISILEAIDDKPGLHSALTDFGVHEAFLGNYQEARKLYDQALILAREQKYKIGESINLINLSILTLREGDPFEAEIKMKQSLTILRDIDYKSPYLRAGPLAYFACIAVDLGQLDKAVILFSAADALFTSKGFRPLPESEPVFIEYQETLKSLINKADFQTAWEIGQTLCPEEAIVYALDEDIPV